MVVTKEILEQYSSMLVEKKEVSDSIAKLENQIAKTQELLVSIESGECVKDKVRGGDGGLQSFVIEGIPTSEYSRKKTELQMKMLKLNERQATLETLEADLEDLLNEVEKYILTLKDSRMRLIIRFKYINNLSWAQVAKKMGGNNTEEGVKSAFHRFFKKN